MSSGIRRTRFEAQPTPRLAFNKTVVTRYRISLEPRQYAPSTINLRLAALRRLAYEAADCGLLSPDLVAAIRRVEGARRLGVRIGNWLTVAEGRRIIGAFGASTLEQRRNRAMIALSEGAAALKPEDIQLPGRTLGDADLNGKAGPIRTVPMPEWVKRAIDEWPALAGIPSGPLFRATNKAGRTWGDGFTPKVIWSLVKEGAANCGLAGLAPHDLHPTCARLCHQAEGELEQIQFLLGHVSIAPLNGIWAANSVFKMP
jgi:integrase